MLFALVALLAAVQVPFSDNQFVESPRILPQLIAAAEAYGAPFKPGKDREIEHEYTYYLRSATYVGNCVAPFGQLHVVSFFFTRSGWKDRSGAPPARGHSFIAFFDGTPRLRDYWRIDQPMEGRRLSFDGTVLSLDGQPLFDYAQLPPHREVIVDGKVQRIPAW